MIKITIILFFIFLIGVISMIAFVLTHSEGGTEELQEMEWKKDNK